MIGTDVTPSASGSRIGAQLIVAAMCTTFIIGLTLIMANERAGHGVGYLASPGEQGSAAALFHHDFPREQLAHGEGHDGQQFYALAREPMHLRDAAHALDRPRYRAQRILLPALGWLLHPSGGGAGLVLALFFWSAVGVALVGIGGAFLLRELGASVDVSTRAALLLPLVPGVIASLGLLGPDALALGLALCACVLDYKRHRTLAIVAGIAAVLAKEPIVLLLVGWAIARPRSYKLALVPAVVAFAWFVALRLTLPSTGHDLKEFEPVVGMARAIKHWVTTRQDLTAAVMVVAAVALGVAALLRRGRAHILAPAIALQLVFVFLLSPDVIALNWNATRTTAPLIVLAIVALLSPQSGGANAPSSRDRDRAGNQA